MADPVAAVRASVWAYYVRQGYQPRGRKQPVGQTLEPLAEPRLSGHGNPLVGKTSSAQLIVLVSTTEVLDDRS